MTERRRLIQAIGEDWQVYARLCGLLIGFVELVASLVGLPVSTLMLGFAGSLLLAPGIAGQQLRRNERRSDSLRRGAAEMIDPGRTVAQEPAVEAEDGTP